MTIENFKNKLKNSPKEIQFSETMSVIEANYTFVPTAFTNGLLKNTAGENSGSCKLFSFAIKQGLSEGETLACFGSYYFDDVLKDPNGNGHQNIRNFTKTGFPGIQFDGEALIEK